MDSSHFDHNINDYMYKTDLEVRVEQNVKLSLEIKAKDCKKTTIFVVGRSLKNAASAGVGVNGVVEVNTYITEVSTWRRTPRIWSGDALGREFVGSNRNNEIVSGGSHAQ